LKEKLPKQRKTQRGKLALLVATMLHVRSANLVELAAGLPLETDRTDMRYQWIVRFLANTLVCCDTVMEPFARDVIARVVADGSLTLIMDQTKASDRHQILMLSLRWGERALPLAWRVEETEGAIGFATQRALLDVVAGWLPPRIEVALMADRFYGTPDLIGWCAARSWNYRLRLKGNLTALSAGQWTTTGEMARSGRHYFEGIELTAKRVATNIGVIKDPGHAEPWIIAMPEKPSYLNTLEYSERWGIEPMFSDFKSRGFGIEQTHIQHSQRLSRLILVMALALYWAVSTGMWDAVNNPTPDEKKAQTVNQESSPAENSPGSPGESAAS
jgi:hypothetical protein